MTSDEKAAWLGTKNLTLTIGNEYHHHFAGEILNSNPTLAKRFLGVLTSPIQIEPRIASNKGVESRAIKADMLNKEIRRLMLNSTLRSHLKLEVAEKEGVFYFSEQKGAIGGFDFAIIDHDKNLRRLHSLCFGQLRYADGANRWRKFIQRNPELRTAALQIEQEEIGTKPTEFFSAYPLIVGEIQFGNWALAYRDFFKVLKANVSNSIDCLIYIVPTGSLELMLSNGIVTFSKAKTILQEFEKVVSVPVWLIGLDFKDT